MSNKNRDEEKLIAFLKEHRPTPPPLTPNSQDRLINAIEKQTQTTLTLKPKLWAIPSTLAACALLFWAGYKWQSPSAKTVMAQDPQELEIFMVNSWGAIKELSPSEYNYISESEFTLASPNP